MNQIVLDPRNTSEIQLEHMQHERHGERNVYPVNSFSLLCALSHARHNAVSACNVLLIRLLLNDHATGVNFGSSNRPDTFRPSRKSPYCAVRRRSLFFSVSLSGKFALRRSVCDADRYVGNCVDHAKLVYKATSTHHNSVFGWARCACHVPLPDNDPPRTCCISGVKSSS